ncbi:hypothetical protein NC652_016004 [Populus alba x Populus x berolinensis]|nr:hypothetical protein NC652_016004 [Populus alba x Populus x berolinensis]
MTCRRYMAAGDMLKRRLWWQASLALLRSLFPHARLLLTCRDFQQTTRGGRYVLLILVTEVTALLPLVVFFMLKLYSSSNISSRKTMLGLLAAGGARTWERHGGEDVYY